MIRRAKRISVPSALGLLIRSDRRAPASALLAVSVALFVFVLFTGFYSSAVSAQQGQEEGQPTGGGDFDTRYGAPLGPGSADYPAAIEDERPEDEAEEEEVQPPPESSPEGESAEEGGGLFGGSGGGEEDGGGGLLDGLMLDGFQAIMGWVYDATIGELVERVGGALQTGVLGLPVPTGEVVEMYDSMVGAMRPAILLGILITALLMMVRTANHDVAYAGFTALPRLLGIGIAFAFLPQFMQILAFMTTGVSETFLPSASQARGAQIELFKATLTNLVGGNILNIIFAAVFCWVGFMVVLVAILKNIMFQLLFIAGPFALAASVIPQTSSLAASWFRGVLACAAIPVLWSIELGIASVIVASPEVLFGGMAGALGGWGDGVFTTVGAIVILWIMYKTPFKVLEWAFESYDSRHGPWRGIVKSLAVGTALHGIKTAMGGAAGGGVGAAAAASASAKSTSGAAPGSSSGGSRVGLGGGMRSGIGGGTAAGNLIGRSAGARSAGAIGAGSGISRDTGRQLSGTQGASGQGALPQHKQQLALPAASPAIEKYLKKEDTSPGMGTPGRSHFPNSSHRSKNQKNTDE